MGLTPNIGASVVTWLLPALAIALGCSAAHALVRCRVPLGPLRRVALGIVALRRRGLGGSRRRWPDRVAADRGGRADPGARLRAPSRAEDAIATVVATLRSVSKTYGRRGVAPTDLDSHRVTVLGPNGAGKTTMLRLLASAHPPTRDHRRRRAPGHRSMHERTAARRCLATCRRRSASPVGMHRVRVPRLRGRPQEWNVAQTRHREVRRVLGLVQLGDRATRGVSKLSGGQRRRLADRPGTDGRT